ncbi:MAG: hypothetical protein QW727_03115 [Candidatus Pacearchaeota archaeon]
MKFLIKKPYIYFVTGIFFFYLVLNFLLSGFYSTIPLILKYSNTINWLKLGTSLVMTLLIGILVSLNSVLIFIKIKKKVECKKEIALNFTGAVGGLIVGVCPLCITGVFPIILGLIGISFSFATLPFEGLEIQVLIFLILLIGFIILKKEN